MSMTRRDLCLMLPATLLPAALHPESITAQESSMPSAMYLFEKLPIRTPNNAEIRCSEGQACHERISGSS